MKRNKGLFVMLLIIIICIGLGIFYYPALPDTVATHWNADNQADGYSGKFIGVFLMPMIMTGLLAMFFFIPLIDPLKKNIEKFNDYYQGFIIIFSMMLFAFFLHSLLWNLGRQISPSIILPFTLGPMFYYAGVMMENAKRNWFIGIRTPWTLSSDYVWDKTHKAGAVLFKLSGMAALFGIIFQRYMMELVLIPVLSSSAFLFAYSFFLYQRKDDIEK